MKRYLLALIPLLAGCAATPPSIDGKAVQPHKIVQWTLNGRLAVNGAQQSGILKFHWQQDGERYLMQFTLPWRQAAYALRGGEGNGVYLLTADNKILHAEKPGSLMQKAVGWQAPLDAFKYWVRGLPAPATPVSDQRVDDRGRIIAMRQAGWQIDIKRYTNINGAVLPDKITMQNRHLQLSLVIQEWDTQP